MRLYVTLFLAAIVAGVIVLPVVILGMLIISALFPP